MNKHQLTDLSEARGNRTHTTHSRHGEAVEAVCQRPRENERPRRGRL